MPRRVSLPGASELFRDTQPPPPADAASGRVRHDEKITVYVSREELLALEQARLVLRAQHGVAADRGRVVREAVAAAIADLDARGGEAELVRRLSTA